MSGWSGRSVRPSSSNSGGQTNQHFDLKFWFSKLDPGSVKLLTIIFLTDKYENKDVGWLKESIFNISFEMFIEHRAHCGRLWVVEVEGKVQVTLEAKLINILIWKLCFFQLLSAHFYFIFSRSWEIQCFLYTVAAMSKSWNIQVAVWHKKGDPQLSFWI